MRARRRASGERFLEQDPVAAGGARPRQGRLGALEERVAERPVQPAVHGDAGRKRHDAARHGGEGASDALHGDRRVRLVRLDEQHEELGARAAGGEIDPSDRPPDRLAEGGEELVRSITTLLLLESLEAVDCEENERRRAPGSFSADELFGGPAQKKRTCEEPCERVRGRPREEPALLVGDRRKEERGEDEKREPEEDAGERPGAGHPARARLERRSREQEGRGDEDERRVAPPVLLSGEDDQKTDRNESDRDDGQPPDERARGRQKEREERPGERQGQ